MKRRCIYIATPTRDLRVGASYSTSLLHTYRYLQEREIDMRVDLISGGGIVQSRNRAVAGFMRDENASHLLFIDDDHTWLPESTLHLLEGMSLYDVHCIGAAYPQRGIDWNKLLQWLATNPILSSPEEASLYASPLLFRMLEGIQPERRGRLLEVEGTGTGFLMCSRSLIRRLWDDSHAYEQDSVDGRQEHRLVFENQWTPPVPGERLGRWWGEDFAFCKRVREMGEKVWLDMFIRLEHIGPMAFVSQCPAEAFMQRKGGA